MLGTDEAVGPSLMDVLILEVGGQRGQSRHTSNLQDKPPRPHPCGQKTKGRGQDGEKRNRNVVVGDGETQTAERKGPD